jgi:hypothetical protein
MAPSALLPEPISFGQPRKFQITQDIISHELQGWPKYLDSPLAWDGSKFQQEEYTYTLTKEEKADVEKALKSFKSGDMLQMIFHYTLTRFRSWFGRN